MKVTTAEQAITRSADIVEKQMGINADEVFWEALSSTIYSTKRWLTEYAQNASDADPDWTLHLPSIINPFCLFVDNGKSMSKDFMLDQGEYEGCGFCTAFSSTKRGTNEASGGFGIGRLTGPQGTMFECRNDDGITRTYVLIKNEHGIPSVMLMAEEKSPKGTHTGVTVKVPVSSRECSEVAQSAQRLLRFFVPTPKGITPPKISKDYGEIVFLSSDDYNYYQRTGPSIIVGGYEYGVSYSEISDAITEKQKKLYKPDGNRPDEGTEDAAKFNRLEYLQTAMRLKAMVLKLPIGSVDVALNRETLRYTERTTNRIIEAFDNALIVIHDELSKEIASSKTLWEARCQYYSIFKSFDNLKMILNPQDIKFGGTPLATQKYGFNHGGMSLPFQVKYIRLRYGRTKKSKFSGMDMHPIDYNSFIVTQKETIIIVDDNVSMINERVEKYIIDKNIHSNYNADINILYEPEVDPDTTPNTSKKTYTIAEQLEYLGNPPHILASTLALPEKLKSKKSTTTKTNSVFKIVAEGYYSTPRNVYDKLDLSKLPLDSVWVPVNNKTPEYTNLSQLMGSSMLSQLTLYGVPKCDRDIIPSTWIELNDYARSLVGDIEDIQKYRFSVEMLSPDLKKYDASYHSFICHIADYVDIPDIIRYNDIAMWLTSLNTQSLARRSELANILGIDIPEWIPKKPIDLGESIKILIEKYPMLRILQSINNRNLHDSEYKLIENSLKAVRV